MSELQTPAIAAAREVELVDVVHLVNRLTGLVRRHEESGRISHALGVRSAIKLVQNDMDKARKARARTRLAMK